jgi:peptidyl-prolyl cis-trans isomerase C
LMVFACSCFRKSEKVTFVARVNNQYLTPERVTGSFSTVFRGSDAQTRDFVTQWVNSALLYEEAKAQGLDRSTQVNETLEEMKKQLAVNRLLETEVYGNERAAITDDEVEVYYHQHQDLYLLAEDLAKVRFVLFASRDAASRLRSVLAKGKSWDEALQSLSGDSLFSAAMIERADSQYIRRSTVGSMELWRTVTQLRVGDLPQIVKDNAGYYVVGLSEIQRAGEVAELPSVVGETRDRVLVEKRQRALQELLERLKKKYSVQLNLSALESVDTLKAKE